MLKGAKPAARTFSYDRKSTEHVIRPGESLTSIAKGYGVPLQQLVAINAISDPNTVKAGTKLRLKGEPAASAAKPAVKPAATATPVVTPAAKATPKPTVTAAATPAPKPAPAAAANPAPQVATASKPATPDWRTYGPLKVDWANWQPMGGSQVAPTLNEGGQSLYLAINCNARKINATDKAGQWQAWEDPQAGFESQMITDLCKS